MIDFEITKTYIQNMLTATLDGYRASGPWALFFSILLFKGIRWL